MAGARGLGVARHTRPTNARGVARQATVGTRFGSSPQTQGAALRVYAPKYGHIWLVVVKNHHGNWEYLGTNALDTDLSTVVERKRGWSLETEFLDSKQFSGLQSCQC